jgi:hypothetical protein
LTLASDRELFALRPAAAGAVPDVTAHFQASPEWAAAASETLPERYRSPRGPDPLDNLVVYESPEGFIFAYADGTRFWMSPDGREIWSRWPEPATLADTETYFVGPVLGFSLRLHGVLCLHASAVVIDGLAVALAGGSSAGKSTTAAAFALAGYEVLSDDLVAVRGTESQPSVAPAYPYLKLWASSERLLFGGARTLPWLTPTWDKRALALDDHGYRFAESSLALGAIVTLAARAGDDDRPRVARSSPTDALLALVPETYAGYLLDTPLRRREFEQLGELLQRVPTFNAEPSDDPARLPALVAGIVEAIRS